MQLVFWQGILSPHQAPYIRALAGRPDWDIAVVAECRMTPDRAAMGWAVPDLGQARVIVPSAISPALVLEECGQDTIHLLEGIRGRSIIREVLPILRKHSARIGIISESANSSGLKGCLRRLAYTWGGLRYATDIDFILAMGSQGGGWYRKCRFPESRIYPFAYVTEAKVGRMRETTQPQLTEEVTLTFLGQLIPRKGGDVLLRALASQPSRNWRLRMTGEGECRPGWERLASQLGISDRVTFTGALPNEKGRALIGTADLLVLPSRFDGWGAVVNEALMQGVPVLCSDRCGARDLLAKPWRGEVFKADSVESLRDVLSRWIGRGKRTPELTERIKTWSRCIEGEPVADYFAAVLRHVYNGAPRPIAPWLRNGSAHD